MWNKNIICVLCLSMLWTIIIKSNNQISVLTTHRVKSNSSHLMNSHAHYLYTCSIFSKYFKTPHRNQSTLLNFDIISRIAGLHRFRTKKIYDTCATWRINPSLNQHTTQWLKYLANIIVWPTFYIINIRTEIMHPNDDIKIWANRIMLLVND